MKDGDKITVIVGGVPYPTVIENGVQRFIRNNVISHLQDVGLIDLNKVAVEYKRGKFTQREYAEFNMSLGYSVCGFAELHEFQDMEIENPLWPNA